MTKEIEIRRFQRNDQSRCNEIIYSGLSEYFGKVDETMNPDLYDIYSSYIGEDNDFLVASYNGYIVGTTGILKQENSLQMVRVFIDPKYRGMGIGKALFNRVLEIASNLNKKEIIVLTEHQWARTISFYKRLGFKEFDKDEIDVHLKYLVMLV